MKVSKAEWTDISSVLQEPNKRMINFMTETEYQTTLKTKNFALQSFMKKPMTYPVDEETLALGLRVALLEEKIARHYVELGDLKNASVNLFSQASVLAKLGEDTTEVLAMAEEYLKAGLENDKRRN